MTSARSARRRHDGYQDGDSLKSVSDGEGAIEDLHGLRAEITFARSICGSYWRLVRFFATAATDAPGETKTARFEGAASGK